MTRTLHTLAITLAIWNLFLVGAISAETFGPDRAVFVAFLAAVLLLLATRKPGARRPTPPALWVVGLVSGFASYPLWVWAISGVVTTAASGTPLPMPFAMVTISGTTP